MWQLEASVYCRGLQGAARLPGPPRSSIWLEATWLKSLLMIIGTTHFEKRTSFMCLIVTKNHVLLHSLLLIHHILSKFKFFVLVDPPPKNFGDPWSTVLLSATTLDKLLSGMSRSERRNRSHLDEQPVDQYQRAGNTAPTRQFRRWSRVCLRQTRDRKRSHRRDWSRMKLTSLARCTVLSILSAEGDRGLDRERRRSLGEGCKLLI